MHYVYSQFHPNLFSENEWEHKYTLTHAFIISAIVKHTPQTLDTYEGLRAGINMNF